MPNSSINDRPKASIDIGTNSTRLLITLIDSSKSFKPLVMQERMTRLGQGVNASGRLTRKAMERVYQALQEYSDICNDYQVSEVRTMATSATRDAANRDNFLREIKRRTGFDVTVLTGEDEAYYSFRGVISDIMPTGRYLVCDIGGGSTEFIFSEGERIFFRHSIDIGSLRLTEEYVRHDPSTDEESDRIRKRVADELQKAALDSEVGSAIFVGGTATTLAMMTASLDPEEAAKAHRLRMAVSDVSKLVSLLQKMTIAERRQLTGLLPERAPVILTGALVVESVMKYFGLKDMTVSLRDLLFGILLD